MLAILYMPALLSASRSLQPLRDRVGECLVLNVFWDRMKAGGRSVTCVMQLAQLVHILAARMVCQPGLHSYFFFQPATLVCAGSLE